MKKSWVILLRKPATEAAFSLAEWFGLQDNAVKTASRLKSSECHPLSEIDQRRVLGQVSTSGSWVVYFPSESNLRGIESADLLRFPEMKMCMNQNGSTAIISLSAK